MTTAAIITSHPTQYTSPWFRELARRSNLRTVVLYRELKGAQEYHDREFGATVRWNIPLLDGIEYQVVREREGQFSWLPAKQRSSDLGESLDAIAPDVVVVFGYAHAETWNAVRWAERIQAPSMLVSDSTKPRARSLARRAAKRPIVRHFYGKVDSALAISSQNRDYHRHYGLPVSRIYSGAIPVDSRFRLDAATRRQARLRWRNDLGIADSQTVVLYLGKLVKHKGVADLLGAVEMASRGSTPFTAIIAGTGPEHDDLRSSLSDKARELVRFTGFVNQAEVPGLMATADVLAAPSHRDAHGMSLAEAVMAGLPLVASSAVGCVGPTDIAQPGRNALITKVGDASSIHAAISSIQASTRLATSMSEASETIADGLTTTVAAGSFERAVADTLRKGKR